MKGDKMDLKVSPIFVWLVIFAISLIWIIVPVLLVYNLIGA